METTKKWQIAIIVCLAAALIACLFWVRSLSERLENLEYDHQRLTDKVGNLDRDQDRLEAELDEMIREANSLTEEFEYTIMGAGTQPNTAAYQFTLVPKEMAENTRVELTVGDTTVLFKRNDNTFTGTVDIPLFEENEGHPVLTVTSAGITKTDELEEIDLWYAYRNCLPQLFQTMSGTGGSEDPEKTSVFMSFGFKAFGDTSVSLTKMTMTQIVNGEEGPCRDVTHLLREDGGFPEFYAPDLLLGKEDEVTVVIRAEDSLGYIHELTTRSGYSEEHGCVVACHDEEERIYGPDGTVLYTSPFEELT